MQALLSDETLKLVLHDEKLRFLYRRLQIHLALLVQLGLCNGDRFYRIRANTLLISAKKGPGSVEKHLKRQLAQVCVPFLFLSLSLSVSLLPSLSVSLSVSLSISLALLVQLGLCNGDRRIRANTLLFSAKKGPDCVEKHLKRQLAQVCVRPHSFLSRSLSLCLFRSLPPSVSVLLTLFCLCLSRSPPAADPPGSASAVEPVPL